MGFTVAIDQFEGPLDLMLHLIKENKLDLFELDMAVLTEQYLLFLKQMEDLHLEVASEFLSELAGLLEYKSKKMLPKEVVEIEEEYEEDHREKLVQRLLEYQMYKTVSEEFETKFEKRQLMHEKPVSEVTQQWMSEVIVEDFVGNPVDLYKAMQRIMRRQQMMKPIETKMKIEELSVDDRTLQIKQKLYNWSGKMSFSDLCDDCNDVHSVIVSFLSILDLVKLKFISVTMDSEDEIWILKGDE